LAPCELRARLDLPPETIRAKDRGRLTRLSTYRAATYVLSMQLKRIVTRLERLLAELSELPPQGEPQRRSSASDIEGVADRWVRKYLRNHRVAAPQTADVIRVLQARAAYAISFASLLPRPRQQAGKANDIRRAGLPNPNYVR